MPSTAKSAVFHFGPRALIFTPVVALLSENLRFKWVSFVVPPLRMEDVIGRHPWDFIDNDSDREIAMNSLCRCHTLGEDVKYFTHSTINGKISAWAVKGKLLDCGVVLKTCMVPVQLLSLPADDVDFIREIGRANSQAKMAQSKKVAPSTINRHATRLRIKLGLETIEEVAALGLAID